MRINSVKLLSVFSTILSLAALPGIAVAQSTSAPASAPAPVSPTSIHLDKLDAPQRATVQALLRERTQQIVDILDENQKSKFYEGLRKRRKLSTTLEDLKLSPDQQNRVNAVISEYDNKIRAVASGQPSPSTQQTTPTTTAPSTTP